MDSTEGFPGVQLKTKKRTIVDSTGVVSKIEDSVLSFNLEKSDEKPTAIDPEMVSIGRWKLNVISLIHSEANSESVIKGWKSLEKLIPMKRLIIPFLYSNALDYVKFNVQHIEPKWTTLLRFCYWYERCLSLDAAEFHYKQTEIKKKILKPLRNVEKTINNRGKGFIPAMEQLNKEISSYTSELKFAFMTYECGHIISFGKEHDFIFDVFPCEVKSLYSRASIELGKDGIPELLIRGLLLGDGINPSQEFQRFLSSKKFFEHISKAYKKGGRIIFLDASHTHASILLYLISEQKKEEFSFCRALHRAVTLAKNTQFSEIPVIILSSISSDEHQNFAFLNQIPFSSLS